MSEREGIGRMWRRQGRGAVQPGGEASPFQAVCPRRPVPSPRLLPGPLGGSPSCPGSSCSALLTPRALPLAGGAGQPSGPGWGGRGFSTLIVF